LPKIETKGTRRLRKIKIIARVSMPVNITEGSKTKGLFLRDSAALRYISLIEGMPGFWGSIWDWRFLTSLLIFRNTKYG